MQIKDFANRLRNRISTLVSRDSNLQRQEVAEEDRLVLEELEELLSDYSQDNRILDDEAMLLPFHQYLANRYHRIVLTHLNYSILPNSKANQVCALLANELVIVANQIQYKKRDVNDLLKPVATWAMDRFAARYVQQIEHLLAHPKLQQDFIVDLESYDALIKLRKTLLPLCYDGQAIVTPETIKPILSLFAARWQSIEDTNADYQENKVSFANQVYQNLAENIFAILEAGRYDVNDLSADHFLRPEIHAHRPHANEELKKTIFKILKDEALNRSPIKPITGMLESFKITEADFVRLIKQELKDIPKDQVTSQTIDVYVESQQTLRNLHALCERYADSDKEINRTMYSAFIEFLAQRWKSINGTLAVYALNPSTSANQACQVLANIMSLAAYHLNHLNREQSRLLMRTEMQSLSTEDAKLKLQQTMTGMLETREKFLTALTQLDHACWNEFLNRFDVPKLINLVTNGQHTTFLNLLAWNESFKQPENENKALLYVMFNIYSRLRSEQASHATYFGGLASLVVSVPDRDQKISAVNEVMKLLASDLSLNEIMKMIKDENSDCHLQHFAALNNGNVKKIMAKLDVAAQAKEQEYELEGAYQLSM